MEKGGGVPNSSASPDSNTLCGRRRVRARCSELAAASDSSLGHIGCPSLSEEARNIRFGLFPIYSKGCWIVAAAGHDRTRSLLHLRPIRAVVSRRVHEAEDA